MRPWSKSAAAGPLAAALLTAGCGSGADDPNTSRAAPPRTMFPAAEGRTLEELAASIGVTDEIVASPAGMVFRPGRNRFGFGLFTVGRKQIENADAAIYAASGPDGQARGPFPASGESLVTKPAFVAETTAADPEAATVVYTSQLDLPAEGEWRLLAVVDDGGKLKATRIPSIEVGSFSEIPAAGERSPAIHTPTLDDTPDLARIDTRAPHDTMHDVDFADALGREPIVLLFATPALCTSRVCGPVVDVAEQVKSEYGGEGISFIHMEVYRGNNVDKGVRPQLESFGLNTEPWLFVVDGAGKVSTAIEGGFGVEELRRAVDRVAGG